MKVPKIGWLIVLVVFIGGHVKALDGVEKGADEALSQSVGNGMDHKVVERGTHHKVVQSVRRVVTGTGETVLITNRYTQIGNGMHRKDASGQWMESKPVVRGFADTVVCTGNTYRVILERNLNTAGAVDLELAGEGKNGTERTRLVSHPLGIGYFDPESGQSVLLARVKDCEAQVVSNCVVYPDAFEGGGIEAAVVYTYDVGRFHQDVTFVKKPSVTPKELGMGERTRIEVFTEIMESPAPATKTNVLKREVNEQKRASMVEADVSDETVIFSPSLRMPLGNAFSTGGKRPSRMKGTQVAKRLLKAEGDRTVLIEAVEWREVSAEIEKLPKRTAGFSEPVPMLKGKRAFPETLEARTVRQPFETRLAQAMESRSVEMAAAGTTFVGGLATMPEGFVIDYQVVHVSEHFYGHGDTLYVGGEVDLTGNTDINVQTIKFAYGAELFIHDYVDNFGVQVLTAKDDDSVGDIIDGSTGNPSGRYGAVILMADYYACLPVGYWSAPLDFRYMNVGIQICFNPSPIYYNADTCILRHCDRGFDFSPASQVTFYADIYSCDVNEEVELGGSENENVGYVSHLGSADCDGDYDNDGLDDGWERRNSAYEPGDDLDSDGLTNLQEYQLHTNPRSSDTDGDGLPDGWEWNHFGGFGQSAEGDYDNDGTSNLQEYQNGTNPNTIQFSLSTRSFFVNSNTPVVRIHLSDGHPSWVAVLVNNTNTGDASWQSYTGTNITVNLGATDGDYDVWVGMRGHAGSVSEVWNINNITFTLDRVPSVVTITNPASVTVTRPWLQIQGHANEPLFGIAYDLANAAENLTNEQGHVTGQFFDTQLRDYTTNFFQCYDVLLTNGVNHFTLRVSDRAGNSTTNQFDVTLDYSGDTEPPEIQVIWPQDGMAISGDAFTLRGTLDDGTAQVTAQVTDEYENTQTIEGLVERDGMFWVENVPLADGENVVTITATDAAGNPASTEITVSKSGVALTIDSTPTGDGLYEPKGTVTGAVSDADYSVSVNGVEAAVDEYGCWTAHDVPVYGKGTATFDVIAAPPGSSSLQGQMQMMSGGSMPNPAHASKDVEKDARAIIVKHKITKQTRWFRDFPDTGRTLIWDIADTKTYEAGLTVDGNGNWKHTYNGTLYDDYYYRYDNGWETDIQWSDTNPGTYQWMDDWGMQGGGSMTWDNYWVGNYGAGGPSAASVPDEDLRSYVTSPVYVSHYFAKDIKHDWADGYWTAETTISEAHTTVTLYTGGKALSGRKNLFRIQCGAQSYGEPTAPQPRDPWLWTRSGGEIKSQDLRCGGKQVGSDGVVWMALPDNDRQDITITAPAKHFNAGAEPSKYYLVSRCGCPRADLARTTVGVGEIVGLYFSQDGSPTTPAPTASPLSEQISWKTTAGSVSMASSTCATTLTSPSNAATATVTATIRGETLSIDFKVVEPTGIDHVDKIGPMPYSIGSAGAGMHLRPYLAPINVSFHAVKIMEVGHIAEVEGYFVTHYPGDHDTAAGANAEIQIGCDNSWPSNYDKAYSKTFPGPSWTTGSYTWPIPGKWWIDPGQKHDIHFSDQTFTINSSGTMTGTKFGHTVTRAVNQSTGTITP